MLPAETATAVAAVQETVALPDVNACSTLGMSAVLLDVTLSVTTWPDSFGCPAEIPPSAISFRPESSAIVTCAGCVSVGAGQLRGRGVGVQGQVVAGRAQGARALVDAAHVGFEGADLSRV